MKMSVIFCMCSLMYKYFIVIDWNKVQNFFCCMYMKNINFILSNVNCWYKSEVYFSKKKKKLIYMYFIIEYKKYLVIFLINKFRSIFKKKIIF